MSKTLFYFGVTFSALLAALAGVQAIGVVVAAESTVPIPAIGELTSFRAFRIASLLLLTVPVAALFIRMSSLLAARNLFAGMFSAVALTCSAISVVALAAIELRMISVHRFGVDDVKTLLASLAEFRAVVIVIGGFFLAVTLMTLAPYFRIQASRFVASVLYLPALVYGWLMIEQNLFAPSRSLDIFSPTPMVFAYLVLVAMIFGVVAVHALRHRHMFLELTSLRELLDRPFDPTTTRKKPSDFGFGRGDVAFDN